MIVIAAIPLSVAVMLVVSHLRCITSPSLLLYSTASLGMSSRHLQSSSTTSSSSEFAGNDNTFSMVESNGKGGCIQNYGVVRLTNFAFTNCTALDGGAIYNGKGSIQAAQGKFTNNRALENGGAMYIEKGSADVAGASFSGNTDTIGSRNVYVEKGAKLTGCEVEGLEGELSTTKECQYSTGSAALCLSCATSWSGMLVSLLAHGGAAALIAVYAMM
jgi:hypothetical protein